MTLKDLVQKRFHIKYTKKCEILHNPMHNGIETNKSRRNFFVSCKILCKNDLA